MNYYNSCHDLLRVTAALLRRRGFTAAVVVTDNPAVDGPSYVSTQVPSYFDLNDAVKTARALRVLRRGALAEVATARRCLNEARLCRENDGEVFARAWERQAHRHVWIAAELRAEAREIL